VFAYQTVRNFGLSRFAPCVAAALLLNVAATPAHADFTTNDAITALQIFADGGEDLVREVSMDVIAEPSAIGSYCMAAGAASTDQKTAIVHGILIATEGAPGDLSSSLADLSRQCCPLFTAYAIDERIGYGVRLALEARRAYEEDRRVSARMTALVSSCADEVLDSSFSLALGEDRIGLYIAQANGLVAGQYVTASGPADDILLEDEQTY